MSQRLHLSAFIKSPPNCIKRRKEKWYTKAKAPQSNPTGKFYYAPCSSKRENPRKGYIFYGIALMSFRCGSFSAFEWRWKAYFVGTECAVVVFISDWRDSLFVISYIYFLSHRRFHMASFVNQFIIIKYRSGDRKWHVTDIYIFSLFYGFYGCCFFFLLMKLSISWWCEREGWQRIKNGPRVY